MRIEANINPLTTNAYPCLGGIIDVKNDFHGVDYEMLNGILARRLKKYNTTP
jgi:hypothetical protein